MNRSYFIYIILCCVLVVASSAGFTCQGTSYNVALNNCPDYGLQKFSNGGNVYVIVKRAINMENKDFSGPAAGVSDPYVQLTFGKSVVAKSKVVRNDLNPVWEEKIHLGVLGSGTAVKFDVYDYDIGVELGDDLLYSTTMRVPFCSTFTATEKEVACGKPFGCSSDDSLWAMPKRKICNETGWINLNPALDRYNQDPCKRGKQPCLLIEWVIVPFTLEVDLIYNKMLKLGAPKLSVLANQDVRVPWSGSLPDAYHFGNAYQDSGRTRFDLSRQGANYVVGALMLQFSTDDKAYGPAEEILGYITTNLPATIYICRFELDNDEKVGLGIPLWLQQWDMTNLTATKLNLESTKLYFQCFFKDTDGQRKNKWGGIVDNAVELRSNAVYGHDDKNEDQSSYNYMYTVLAIPRVAYRENDDVIVTFESDGLLQTIGYYGIIWYWFMYLTARFLTRIKFRLERIESYFVSLSLIDENKNILAALLLNYNRSPSNVAFRGTVYHVRNIIYFMLTIPIALLFTWGVCATLTVQPAALGTGISYIGLSYVFFWFTINCWESQKWRMSPIPLASLALSAIFVIIFIISTIFVDPAVVKYGHKFNFSALSLLFGSLNCMPLILLIFQQDKAYKDDLQKVITLISKAAYEVAEESNKKFSCKKRLPANKALHAMLGAAYTINPLVPQFKFAAMLADSARQKKEKKVGERPPREDSYNLSLFLLFVYLMIALARTNFGGLAFLNCLTCLLFDTINSSLSHGDIRWSIGFKILLLVVGRLLIMGSGTDTWLVGYCISYLVFAGALINEIINSSLPMLTKEEAAQRAFFGVKSQASEKPDVAGTAFFNLGLFTFVFIGLLIAFAYSENPQQPFPTVSVLGQQWPQYVFGLIAVLGIITGGLLTATLRAFYLQANGLLLGYAQDLYFIWPSFDFPKIIATTTEVSIIWSGALIRAATGANAILVVSIFAPFIFLCFGYCYSIWLSNDFDLVVWPPKGADDEEMKFDERTIIQEDAAKVEEEIAVRSEVVDDHGEKRSLKGFTIPPLKVTGSSFEGSIKMPPLPLKSALRKKRDAMGIKVKAVPLVKDLRAREGAEVDKFGSGDVIDANDPWAQFEESDDDDIDIEEVSLEIKKQNILSSRKKAKFTVVRKSLMEQINENPYVVETKRVLDMINSQLRKSRLLARVMTAIQKFFGDILLAINSRRVRYQTIAPTKEELLELALNDNEKESETERFDSDIREGRKKEFWTAALSGFLTDDEYRTLCVWYLGLFLIFLMGETLSNTVEPAWLGHCVWVGIFLFLHTFIPIYKYFNVYRIDDTMKACCLFSVCLHFIFCLSFLVGQLGGDIGVPAALWITDFFFYYPAIVYLIVEGYKWIDGGWKLQKLDEDGDGKVTVYEWFVYMKAYPFLFAMMIVFDWHLYLWVNYLAGLGMTLLLLVAGIGYVFVRDWATNDFFVSPEFTVAGGYIVNCALFILSMLSVFNKSNPVLELTLFFLLLMGRQFSDVFKRIIVMEPDTLYFISPFILPVYSYHTSKEDIKDESATIKACLYFVVSGIGFGFSWAIFVTPIDIGIATSCFFMLIIVAALAAATTYVPLQLGNVASMVTVDMAKDAAEAAKNKFLERRTPLDLNMNPLNWSEPEDLTYVEPKTSSRLEELMQSASALEIASEILIESRSLTHVKASADLVTMLDLLDGDEMLPTWYEAYFIFIKNQLKKLFEIIPMGQMAGYRRHSESLFTFADFLAEAVIVGKGPLGFLGMDGLLYSLFLQAQEDPRLKWLKQPWLNAYDSVGNCKSYILLSERVDIIRTLQKFSDLDQALDYCYMEEVKCCVHYLSSLIVVAESRLSREKINFQKFMRDYRFKLAERGVNPPRNIFASNSFSSIDIPLVAVWISTFSREQEEMFNVLKTEFYQQQALKGETIDNEDYELMFYANKLKDERAKRVADCIAKALREGEKEMMLRTDDFMATLDAYEKASFQIRMRAWTSNSDCYIDSKDLHLYERFKSIVFVGDENQVGFAERSLEELETASRNCHMGEYGRNYQFVDSEFTPGPSALGKLADSSAWQVAGWRCSPGIRQDVKVFDDGADANDVFGGVFHTQWILAAICMLASGGGDESKKDGVHDTIRNLFVGRKNTSNYDTSVGAYCVRFFKQGMSIPLILDDLFPMLKRDLWNEDNMGIASARSKGYNELWVSLVEKAFAKFYGSYAAIEKGYIQHALEDLTGCETDCICLAPASRGFGKETLWEQLTRYKKNGYILGCSTGSSSLADHDIAEMGIQFNSSYTIFDVRYIDGYKLLKLRNPPGDHEEWNGDWGDKSSLWNRRLKARLGWTDEDDNTFWMCLDDFCNVFRYLYVCKWYSKSWKKTKLSGDWKKNTVLEEEEKLKLKRLMIEEDESMQGVEIDEMEEKRKIAKASVDTSGGLPNKHNPTCILENNPHYSLNVYRPTDICITVSQCDSRGVPSEIIHPFAIYVAINEHPTQPMRLKNLTRENVISYSGEPTMSSTQTMYLSLKPGLYMVLVGVYRTGMEGHFTITMLSNYRADLISVWPPSWMLKVGGKEDAKIDLNKEADSAEAGAVEMGKKIMKNFRKLFGSGDAEQDSESDDDN